MDTMNNPTEEDEDQELVGMGLRVSVSPAQTAFYIILVLLGILGNATVVAVIGKSVIKDRGGGRNSDIIIINMALSNLLVSLMRNTLLVISDIGLEVCGSSFLKTENQSPFSLRKEVGMTYSTSSFYYMVVNSKLQVLKNVCQVKIVFATINLH